MRSENTELFAEHVAEILQESNPKGLEVAVQALVAFAKTASDVVPPTPATHAKRMQLKVGGTQ